MNMGSGVSAFSFHGERDGTQTTVTSAGGMIVASGGGDVYPWGCPRIAYRPLILYNGPSKSR